jgi:hypothetical protein
MPGLKWAAHPKPLASPYQQQQEEEEEEEEEEEGEATAEAEAPMTTRVLRVDPALLAAAAAAPAARYALPPAPPPAPAGTGSSNGNAASSSGDAAAAALSGALAALEEAGALLRAGQLVGLPTETVYGLAANALDAAAVARVFAAKGRPADNPLIVHVSDMEMLARLYPGGALTRGVTRGWRSKPAHGLQQQAAPWAAPCRLSLGKIHGRISSAVPEAEATSGRPRRCRQAGRSTAAAWGAARQPDP